ncbi:MAG TPA: hypothetical protein VLA92_03625 [Candidatus Saccharimonadales bacterium]|nr:hypothetical protein [Candidatus Saccharimonadales bacterium]
MSLYISKAYEFEPHVDPGNDSSTEDVDFTDATGLSTLHRGALDQGGWPMPEACGDALEDVTFEETATGFIGRALLAPTAVHNAIEIGE